jgi:hypothetical protein
MEECEKFLKKVIYHFIFLFISVLYVISVSCKAEKNTVPVEKTESVRIDEKPDFDLPILMEEIPIMAWYGVQEHTIERYRELKECGIDYNFSRFPNVELLAQAMDIANKEGIKMIIHCPELETEPEKIVNRFKEHPALVGYHLQDEPNRNDFFRLSELSKRIQAVDNKNICYINLFPNYASSEQLGISDYLDYVKLFIQEVPVKIISFDHYPIRKNAGIHSLYSRWYENLEIISNEARKAGKSFWAFALTSTLSVTPIPSLEELRLQVYSNFAYGAQGIQYYTYWGVDGEYDAPIDAHTGQKTATWYTVQQVNKEIKALSNVFLGANVIQVRHIVKTAFGTNGKIPSETTRFKFSNRPTEANIIKTFKIPNKTNAVISFLKNGNRYYMVIINRNLSGGKNVTFKIKGGDGLQLINKDGTIVNTSAENIKQIITPGDVLIYGWDIM